MNDGWVYRDKVNKSGAGQTVLQYYTKRYRHSTETQWRERIESNQILLDGKATTADTLLQLGQKLAYHRSPWKEPEVPLCFKIIHEDADLLIINKPSGLPVLPGGGFLQNTLLYQLQKLAPQNTPIPIHRLGRGTSGLMLLARSQIAKSNLSEQMRNHAIKKVYIATVQGIIVKDEFIIRDRIGKIPHPILGYIYGATPTGKYSRSDCKVIQRNLDRTIVEVTILTGRPHQIRIHLAAVGYPLVNDPLYGIGGIPKIPRYHDKIFKVDGKTRGSGEAEKDKIVTPGDCGYYLHAYQLGFKHPISKKQVSFTCASPL
ncbi:putative enzyme [Hyella patelloides LEGE 07179]|uniref:Pseudouridine synthase n=1 Tax=Hyella patelloides LEGE 07179 TaxID=945734 RepID=A0A563VL52_9CYAN|nr:RluA family pseudouridine synthase [Hyella patelloides]VEP12148.1 putative enzyme [Hyella patelloides LEGE 07179]